MNTFIRAGRHVDLLFRAVLAVHLCAAFADANAQSASLPVDTYKSFRVVTAGFTDRFLRHQDGVGITSAVDTESSRGDVLDATFLIAPGLADSSCYSLQANNYPGSYLRHSNGAVQLAARSADAFKNVFDADATWCAVPGLAGGNVSLRSKNFPSMYLRHMHGKLALTDSSVVSSTFTQDATWKVTTALTDSVPTAYPVAGKSKGAGVLPVVLQDAANFGEISSSLPIPRDVGFTGVVNGQIVWTFADTLKADLSKTPAPQQFCTSTSAALGNFKSPLQVTDLGLQSNGCPREWIPFFGEQVAKGVSQWANWVTNVIEVAPNKGLVWFNDLERNTAACTGMSPCKHGAGVATVTADEHGAVALRTSETVWNGFEPVWGDGGAAYDARDGYVYVFGRGPHSQANVYLARALADNVMDANKYQYFDNSTKRWGSTRFTDDGRNGTIVVSDNQALFKNNSVDQTTPFWSNYYNSWMMVYGDHWSRSNIYLMTAPNLEGPWTKHPSVNIPTCPTADCSNDAQWHYSVAGHPEFDPSGKSVVVTWSTWPDNRIYAKKLTFK